MIITADLKITSWNKKLKIASGELLSGGKTNITVQKICSFIQVDHIHLPVYKTKHNSLCRNISSTYFYVFLCTPFIGSLSTDWLVFVICFGSGDTVNDRSIILCMVALKGHLYCNLSMLACTQWANCPVWATDSCWAALMIFIID